MQILVAHGVGSDFMADVPEGFNVFAVREAGGGKEGSINFATIRV